MGAICCKTGNNFESKSSKYIAACQRLTEDFFREKKPKEADARVFFASMKMAVRSLLCCQPDEAQEFMIRAYSNNTELSAAFDSFSSKKGGKPPHASMNRARVMSIWMKYDEDNSGDLVYSELKKLVKGMNFPDSLSKKILSRVKDTNKCVTYPQFEKGYMEATTFKELGFVFDELAHHRTEMNRATFMHFLRNTQGENVDDASVEELMLSLGSADGREIDKTEFLEFLSSPEHNSFIKKEKLFNVYQDMTRPICDYFINSSHNTYLTGDQLASKSSTDMYRKALLEGCRCVELDCWNGSKDEPVVYHGHTRTSKILFSDCIKAIKDTAFQNSPFPVILSLEVHTNLTQQDRMADIMVEIFGELLLKPAWGSGEPPTYSFSPEQLKNKILVKTKRGNFASEPGVDKDEDDEDDDVVTPSVSVNEDYKKAKEERKKDEKVDISEKLSAAVCIESTGYKGVDDLSYLSTRQPYNCSSLSEGKAKKLYQQNFEAFVKINQKCLSRIYPAGIRFDSSNYNPQIYWNCGCQIVALNWQSTKTFEWRFNRSFFLDNGNCGYLLKPEELCAPNTGVPKSSDKRSIFVPSFRDSASRKPSIILILSTLRVLVY
ncbi:phospholipase C, delta [Strigomonas culicis]|uniref:Phosphoinositide phospholipase C n=1 Tax=Strigomonas culicis TaxID=28005 RepID=S9UVH4_9TRYP|nr:phospholipase C, delta [Strigomonas culicis]|eukprot:EPY18506.1 phospholipase C, delta [Strigomonas culicis]